MRLLLDFLCRFGWGMAVGLVLTPASIVPAGFFRVNLLVVMGLATGAAAVAWQGAAASPAWLPATAAAVTAWLLGWLDWRRLPRVAMETLAVIAWHQPVTRGEIEEIRGAGLSQATLEALLENGLIAPNEPP
jgi:hypothetical protein